MTDATPKAYALLIDGDNAQPDSKHIELILKAVKQYGDPIIKRVYGDFSTDALKNWQAIAREHDLKTEQNYHNSNGKNATDIVLVIDAMDLLHDKKDKLDGFCIVSSDSDFTHLIRRIREDGLHTIGIGKGDSKTLAKVFHEFIPVENLENYEREPTSTPVTLQSLDAREKFQELLLGAYDQAMKEKRYDNNRRVKLSELRDLMKSSDSAFMSGIKGMPAFVNEVKALDLKHLELVKETNDKTTTHYLLEKPEIDMFYHAYIHARDDLKLKDEQDWVLLSLITEKLKELYPHYDPYVYKGRKIKQVKKVVESMVDDYPSRIKLDTDSLHPKIRMNQ